MRDSSSNSILGFSVPAALLAFLAMLPFVGREPAPQSPAASRADTTPTGPRVVSPTGRAFTVGCRLIDQVRGVPRLASATEADGCRVEDPSRVRVLIALLPDAEDSSLDWVFDAHLSSIRRAVEVAGFAPDRAWMPSSRRRAPLERDTAGVVTQDTTLVLKESEAFPGVVVFRDSGGTSTQDLLVVYVVGELPTAGVHKTALWNALDEASRISTDAPLRILGPTFSGSAASLHAGLASWGAQAGERCRPVLITTGSATSGSVPALIARQLPGCMLAGRADTAVVKSTVRTDGDYAAALRARVLEPLNLDPQDVAVLVESNTGYGQGQVSLIPGALEVRFPLNIASMRSEYARNPQSEESEVNPRPRARLPLSLGLQARPGEAPPVSSALTPPSIDLLTKDILEALRSRRVRAVGILATDVRDKLFLAELVRRELKDVLLFTFEGHVLYLREDLGHVLSGMVVVSSYPLTRGNARWAGADQLFPFPSDGAAGVYNAAVHLLGKPELAQQYGGPLQINRPPAPPPVWITTIGTGSVLPVAVLESAPLPEMRAESGEGSSRATPRPGLLDTVTLLVLLGSVVSIPVLGFHAARTPPGIWLWNVSRSPRSLISGIAEGGISLLPGRAAQRTRELAKAGWRLLVGAITWESDRYAWNVLDGCAFAVALLAFFAPFALLNSLSPAWEGPKGDFARTAGSVIWVDLVAFLVTLVSYAVVKVRRKKLEMSNRPGQNSVTLMVDLTPHALVILLALLALGYCYQIASLRGGDSTTLAFYQLRTLQLDSGASGMLLLLVASVGAALAVGWHRDRRTRLEDPRAFEEVCTEFTDATDSWTEPFGKARDAVVRIRAALDFRHAGALLVIVLAAVAVIAVVRLNWQSSYRTSEDLFLPAGFAITTVMLWTGLGVGFLSILATVIHLIIVWRPLSLFLDRIAETPLAPAFERIPARLRGLGKLHIFDPPDESLGIVLANAGHRAAWSKAHELKGSALKAFKGQIDETPLDTVGDPNGHKGNLSELLGLTRQVWEKHPELIWAASKPPVDSRPTPTPKATALPKSPEPWLRQAEEVIAVEITRYVAWVLSHIRRIATLMLGLLLFTTLFLEVLPIPFHAMFTTILVVLMVLGVGTVVVMLLHLAQDDVLSRITGSEPGKLNWNAGSLVQALVFVAVPLLALLSTEVAPVGQTLFGWVGGVLRILSTI